MATVRMNEVHAMVEEMSVVIRMVGSGQTGTLHVKPQECMGGGIAPLPVHRGYSLHVSMFDDLPPSSRHMHGKHGFRVSSTSLREPKSTNLLPPDLYIYIALNI